MHIGLRKVIGIAVFVLAIVFFNKMSADAVQCLDGYTCKSGWQNVGAAYRKYGSYCMWSNFNQYYCQGGADNCTPDCVEYYSDSSCTENIGNPVNGGNCWGCCTCSDTSVCGGDSGGGSDPCAGADCNYGSCPAPLTDTCTDISSISCSEVELDKYLSCEKVPSGCGTKTASCYEPISNRIAPEAWLNIIPNTTANSLGFSSSTYSGETVNEPVNIVATAYDENGVDDIEAVYVWFRSDSYSGGIPVTPQYFDPWTLGYEGDYRGKTFTTNSFGFMLHKENGQWLPYVIRQDGDYYTWVRSVYENNEFYIYGPDSTKMVKVRESNIAQDFWSNGKAINFELSLQFYSGDIQQYVSGDLYNVYVMANDVFGFTPYDNYEGVDISAYWNVNQLRDYDNWVDSTKDWNVDIEDPVSNSLEVTTESSSSIKVSWDIHDTQGLYGVVGNIYASNAIENPSPITFVNADSFKLNSGYTFDYQEDTDIIGHLNNGYAFKKVNLNTTDMQDSITIDVGSNRGGKIIIYLTVFDYGGNIQSGSSDSYDTYDLRDWMVSRGGFVYSSEGTSFDLAQLESNLWTSTVLNSVGLLSEKADISTELFGDIRSISKNPLLHTSLNQSFYINEFESKANSYYEDLLKSFENRISAIQNKEELNIDTLTGSMCTTGDCLRIFYKIPSSEEENLTVEQNFNCNGKGIFFVSGTLTINPDLLNTNINKDACIFVVRGNVIIKVGIDKVAPDYDLINAFVITDGRFIIEPDLDGLLVNGGLVGYGNNTILMERYLDLLHKRDFPALAVTNHPKYGIFSKEVIGNKVNLVKTEVGFKPF